MDHRRAVRYVLLWFVAAVGYECLGVAVYAVHAGWLGVPGISTGPIAVLIVEETEARSALAPGQREAILSNAAGSVRDYCKTHGEKDAAGVPEFRVLDKDDSVAKESPVIQELFAAKRDGVPWIIVKRGGTIVSEALPKTEAETLALLQRYGGK